MTDIQLKIVAEISRAENRPTQTASYRESSAVGAKPTRTNNF